MQREVCELSYTANWSLLKVTNGQRDLHYICLSLLFSLPLHLLAPLLLWCIQAELEKITVAEFPAGNFISVC